MINQTGAVLFNIVCDNPPVNYAMLRHLGASLDPDKMKPIIDIQKQHTSKNECNCYSGFCGIRPKFVQIGGPHRGGNQQT